MDTSLSNLKSRYDQIDLHATCLKLAGDIEGMGAQVRDENQKRIGEDWQEVLYGYLGKQDPAASRNRLVQLAMPDEHHIASQVITKKFPDSCNVQEEGLKHRDSSGKTTAPSIIGSAAGALSSLITYLSCTHDTGEWKDAAEKLAVNLLREMQSMFSHLKISRAAAS